MKKLFTFLALVTFLAACAPSPQAIQTAIAQTQEANPTSTLSPNLLVLQRKLSNFLLQKSDLPLDGQYHQFVWSPFPIPNDHVESANVEETGRLDGWEVYYIRGSNSVNAPQEIHGKVVLYKTSAGAQLSITKYSDDLVTDFGYIEEINLPEIGDASRAFLLRYLVKPNSSESQISYWIEFSYRNIVEVVRADGGEHEVQPESVRNIADLLLARLQASPLLNP
jgi:hypothetical protein